MPCFAEVYGKQVLRPELNTTGSEERLEASKVFVKKITVVRSGRTSDSCRVPAGFFLYRYP